MNFEIARLAQKLKLTKAELRTPRILALLENHIAEMKQDQKRRDSSPGEMPKKPGAINHMYGWADYRQSKRDK